MMRMMTYNIRLGLQQGLQAVARVIAESGADIVALQEVGQSWTHGPSGDTTAELSGLTGLAHYCYAPAIFEQVDGRAARYGHALLSRWPILDANIIALPQNIDEPRVLMATTIAAPDGPVHVLSTHLSYRDADRPAQAQLLLDMLPEWLTRARGTHFVMGDLNADPSEDAWIATLKTLMIDTDANEGAPTYPADAPRLRLDYLLCDAGRWTDAAVLPEIEASDHRPVVATWHRDSTT